MRAISFGAARAGTRRALAVAALLALAAGGTARAQAPPPKVLLTGDSMMEVLQRSLVGELRSRALDPVPDARVGTGITKKTVVDWRREPARQARRHRADVTIAFLGIGDIYDFPRAKCCGEAWVAEYARRVGAMNRAWGGRVFWLTLPTPAHADLARFNRAVNRAIRRVAEVIDIAATIAPRGRFVRRMRWGGETLTIRASDGVHLSAHGSRIASELIADALAARGLAAPG